MFYCLQLVWNWACSCIKYVTNISCGLGGVSLVENCIEPTPEVSPALSQQGRSCPREQAHLSLEKKTCRSEWKPERKRLKLQHRVTKSNTVLVSNLSSNRTRCCLLFDRRHYCGLWPHHVIKTLSHWLNLSTSRRKRRGVATVRLRLAV